MFFPRACMGSLQVHKNMHVWFIGDSKLSQGVSVHGCVSRLSLCGPVMDWRHTQGVPCLSPCGPVVRFWAAEQFPRTSLKPHDLTKFLQSSEMMWIICSGHHIHQISPYLNTNESSWMKVSGSTSTTTTEIPNETICFVECCFMLLVMFHSLTESIPTHSCCGHRRCPKTKFKHFVYLNVLFAVQM